MKVRTVIGSLSFGLLLSFSGLMASSCASGDKDKDGGSEMASEDGGGAKKKKKKKKGKKAKKTEDAGAGGDAPAP